MAPREERTQKLQTEPGSQSSGCQVLPVNVLLAPQEHKLILVEAEAQRGHVNYPKSHSQCGRAIMSISEHLSNNFRSPRGKHSGLVFCLCFNK